MKKLSNVQELYRRAVDSHASFARQYSATPHRFTRAFTVDPHFATHSNEFLDALSAFLNASVDRSAFLAVEDDTYRDYLRSNFNSVPAVQIEGTATSEGLYQAFRASPEKDNDSAWAIMPFMGMDGTFLIPEQPTWELRFAFSEDRCEMVVDRDTLQSCRRIFSRIKGVDSAGELPSRP